MVIGDRGNRDAAARVDALEECGALVRLIEPSVLADSDLADAFFVTVVAPDDRALGARVQRLAQKHRFLYSCIDRPQYGHVAMTAIARAGPTRIAISTSGNAPAVAKALREALERDLDERFRRFVERVGLMRAALPSD